MSLPLLQPPDPEIIIILISVFVGLFIMILGRTVQEEEKYFLKLGNYIILAGLVISVCSALTILFYI